MANLGLKNNNPGNLKDPTTGQFRVFNSPEEGHQALLQDIQTKQSGKSPHIKPGASISDLAKIWAPASDKNVPANWAKNVASAIGVDPSVAFDKVPADKLAQGISAAEGTSSTNNPTSYPIGQAPWETKGNSNSSNSYAVGSAPWETSSNTFTASPDQTQHTGTLGTNSNDSLYGKLIDNSITRGVQKYGDITGGNKVGQAIGTLGGYALEKLKGAFGGQDNSKSYDLSAPSPVETGFDAARMVSSGLGIKGAGGLLSKAGFDIPFGAVTDATGTSAGLQNPIAKSIIEKYIPEDVGGKSLAELMGTDAPTAAMKYDALTKALSNAAPSEVQAIQNAIDEIAPAAHAELGSTNFAEQFPKLAKTFGLLGKGAKWSAILAPILAGGAYAGRGLLNQVLQGKDLSNRSKPFNQP